MFERSELNRLYRYCVAVADSKAEHLGRPKGTVLSIVHRMPRRLEDTGARERTEG